jgi:gluconate 5-dehydrogenase
MKNDIFDLTGKVAVVTGGAGHLGSAISEGLARAGADVFIADIEQDRARSIAELIRGRVKGSCNGVKADISDTDSVEELFRKVNAGSERLDILVNNAYYGSAGSLESMKDDGWSKGIDGTLGGVFRCTRAVVPYMPSGGSIINIASMYGMVSPDPGIYRDTGFDNPPNYGAGKAGIIQFTRYAACHLASRAIRVNSISPGAFPNAQIQESSPGFIKRLCEKTPMKRIGQPEDLEGAVLFLSSASSSYVTGINIPVDGGWTAW